MSVEQPPLTLTLPTVFTHDGWINHDGVAAAASALALWSVAGGEVWLRSDGVAGKSHLMQAVAHELRQAALLVVAGGDGEDDANRLSAAWMARLQPGRRWLIDIAAGALPEQGQLALFHLIERGRREGVPMVVGWRCPDAAITRPELLSRLRAMQQLPMAPPVDDGTLLALLEAELRRMQWQLNGAVLRYLLGHTHRELGALLATLHRLHQRSLAAQCKPSPANIRRLLEG